MNIAKELLNYLNDKYTINGAFYWIGEKDWAKIIPSSQRNISKKCSVAPGFLLNAFGIGGLEKYGDKYVFMFYIGDLKDSYGFKLDRVIFEGTDIDEVMNAVVAYIIVNGMCDLRHRDLPAS